MDPSTDRLRRRIQTALEQRDRRTIERHDLVPAAVLLPLLGRPQGVQVLFAKRSEEVPHHKGQISFPGGVVSTADPSRLHTVLREAREEIGLSSETVEILGSLDDTEATTQFVVTPFVGLIGSPAQYVPDGKEIERIIEIPLQTLRDPAIFKVEEWELNGRRRLIYVYHYEGEVIWGVTARILKQFLDLVFGEPDE